jgi:hypothetical protein
LIGSLEVWKEHNVMLFCIFPFIIVKIKDEARTYVSVVGGRPAEALMPLVVPFVLIFKDSFGRQRCRPLWLTSRSS